MRFSIAIFLAVPVRVINDYARRHTILALVNINKPFPNFQNVAIGYVNTRNLLLLLYLYLFHFKNKNLGEKVVSHSIALLYLYLFHFKNKNLREKNFLRMKEYKKQANQQI